LTTSAAATASSDAVWLPLERLRQLPLEPAARLALLRELSARPQPGRAALELWGELAELTLRCCEDAYQQQRWSEALEHHDALLPVVRQLAEVVPKRAGAYWKRYGELLAFFTAAVHGVVSTLSSDPAPPLQRATLCWELAKRLQRASALPIDPPDWLAVHEQQLVQDGALFWQELSEEPQASRRALQLLLRLDQLLQPAPEWVQQQARGLVEQRARALLEEPAPDPAELEALLADLELLPLALERREAMEAALTRARLALELIAPELAPLTAAPEAVDTPSEPAAQPAAAAEPLLAQLVLLDEGVEATPLQLNLRPLLLAEFEAIEAALEDFVWHLPRGSRALPAAPALQQALEPRWRLGRRLPAEAFERLAYLAAAWQRRMGERLEPLPPLDWRHSLLLELDATELAVLRPLLADAAQLEAPLAQLRREHHNPAFWQQRQELPWMQCPTPLEALRRLHAEQGFYSSSQGPLQSLIGWGGDAVRALLEAELWTDDAGCLGPWLAVAQELAGRGEGPLPVLAAPPAPEQLLAELGGLEVVYAGEQAAAVREAHRAGRCFRGEPFGLRVLEGPASRWPARPAGGFEQSLAVLLAAVEELYAQRPFAVLLADCGAYRLPLLRAMHQRYGVAALSSGRPMASWLVAGAA
jgi:hypothetical protein